MKAVSCVYENESREAAQDFLEVGEAEAGSFGDELGREGVGELDGRVALEFLLPVLHVERTLWLVRIVEGTEYIYVSSLRTLRNGQPAYNLRSKRLGLPLRATSSLSR